MCPSGGECRKWEVFWSRTRQTKTRRFGVSRAGATGLHRQGATHRSLETSRRQLSYTSYNPDVAWDSWTTMNLYYSVQGPWRFACL